ncbi:MAG: hypothetical protein AAGC45_14295 [Bacteroidota bacterium]
MGLYNKDVLPIMIRQILEIRQLQNLLLINLYEEASMDRENLSFPMRFCYLIVVRFELEEKNGPLIN